MGIETSAIELTGKGIIGFWKNVVKPFLNKRSTERKELLHMVQSVHKELQFNCGTSIKDAIWDVKKQLINIDTKLNGLKEDQHLAMNLQGIAFWVSDENGECVYASTSLCKLLGRNETELLGNAWVGWLIPEDRERIYESWQFSVENKSAFDEYYTFKKSDGKKQKVWGLAFHKKIAGVHAGTMGKLEGVGEPF